MQNSKDIWARGWNVELKKAGKSLCVVYPEIGPFSVLVVVGNKEKERVENQLPDLSKEIQELYQNTKEGNGQRWLIQNMMQWAGVSEERLKRESLISTDFGETVDEFVEHI